MSGQEGFFDEGDFRPRPDRPVDPVPVDPVPLDPVPLDPDPTWSAAQLIARALVAQPGPAWIAALDALPLALPARERVLFLQAWARQTAWLAAREQPRLAAVDGPEWQDQTVSAGRGHDWAREEVALALAVHPATAAGRIDTARALGTDLAPTWRALQAGDISLAHARVVAERLEALSADQAAAVQARVLPGAGDQTPGQLGRRVDRAVLSVAPDVVEVAHAAAVEQRDVRYRGGRDGMGQVSITGAAQACLAAYRGLLAAADRGRAAEGEVRTRAQLRSDIATDLLGGLLDGPDVVREHGARVAVRVTISLRTLLDLAETPALLEGHGWIGAEQARRIARAGSAFSRLVYGPVGEPVDVSPDRRFALAALERHVVARDQTCSLPVCDRPAATSDLDHALPWSVGGSTTSTNLGPFCPRHHLIVEQPGWSRQRHRDGMVTITTPAGLSYTFEPPGYDWEEPDPPPPEVGPAGPAPPPPPAPPSAPPPY